MLETKTGEEGLEAMGNAEEVIDLLIADVIMPGMGGPTFLMRARELQPDGRSCQTAQGPRVPLNTATAWKGIACPKISRLAPRVLVPCRRRPLRASVTTVR